jgi:hypothetical protein
MANAEAAPTMTTTNRAHRHAERGRGLVVAEPRPHAQRDDVPLLARQPRDAFEHGPHLCCGLGAGGDVGRRSSGLARQLLHECTVTPECPPTVAEHVRRDPVEPGQELAVYDDDLIPTPERLEEDDRREILGLRPVGESAKQVVVDRPCMPLVELGERVLIALCARPKERLVTNRHMRMMCEQLEKFHRRRPRCSSGFL